MQGPGVRFRQQASCLEELLLGMFFGAVILSAVGVSRRLSLDFLGVVESFWEVWNLERPPILGFCYVWWALLTPFCCVFIGARPKTVRLRTSNRVP